MKKEVDLVVALGLIFAFESFTYGAGTRLLVVGGGGGGGGEVDIDSGGLSGYGDVVD